MCGMAVPLAKKAYNVVAPRAPHLPLERAWVLCYSARGCGACAVFVLNSEAVVFEAGLKSSPVPSL